MQGKQRLIEGAHGREHGDYVGSDKVLGDKVLGDKHVHYCPRPRPTIDLDEARQLLNQLPPDTVPNPAPLPAGSRMHLPPNMLFVGRTEALKALSAPLKAGSTTVIVAATGLGEIGKIQLASEFVHRYGRFFAGGVLWMSFAETTGVAAEVACCGSLEGLNLREDFDTLPPDDQIKLVCAAWREPIPHLLIFDNDPAFAIHI